MRKQVIIDGVLTNYWVEDNGTFFNKNGRQLKVSEKGVVQLYIDNKNKGYSAGKIIANTFKPCPYNVNKGLIIHLDSNMTNNNVNNLEWISSLDNVEKTWEKRRKNGTTGAGKKHSIKRKNEKIVGNDDLKKKLHINEKIVVLDGIIYPYAISNMGILRNLNTNHVSNGYKNASGYIIYSLNLNGKQVRLLAHRLVALTYFGCPEPGKKFVDHINGIRDDNRVENLRWVSSAENRKNVHKNNDYLSPTNSNYSFNEELPEEIWKTFRQTKYLVSNKGRVRGLRGNILKGTYNNNGYHLFYIEGKKMLAHRIVWECFGQPKNEEGYVINHINGIKSDNRIENLEEITQQENCLKAARETFSAGYNKVGAFNSEGELLVLYANASAAAEAIGIMPGSMRNSIRRNGKCHDGLYYRYLDK